MVGAILQVARADAVLEGFDSPDRIPDSYVIVFKDLPDFAALDQETNPAEGWTSWEIRKRNRAKVSALADEIASLYHCRELTNIFWVSFYGFSGEFAEADILALAKDPRIERIETAVWTQLATP